jgi:iron complex outermembrane receptor protein
MYKYTLSLSLCATLVASLGADALTLEPIRITSNTIETDELRAPYAVEVYTSREIEKSHANTIYDFFTTQNSLIISPNYNSPFAQKIDLHGYGSGDTGYQNIVVTLDGRRLNNIDLSPQILGSIPLNIIERIEILKGSGSVLYGDGANAAVINIITKKGNQNQLTLSGGTYDTQNESLYLSSLTSKYAASLHFDHYDTQGIRTIDTHAGTDTQKSTNGGITLSFHPITAMEIFGSADFTRNDSFYGGTMTLSEYRADPTQQGHVDYGWGSGLESSTKTGQTTNIQTVTAGIRQDISSDVQFQLNASQEIKQTNFAYYSSATPTLTTLNYQVHQLHASLDYDSGDFSAVLGGQATLGKRISEQSSYAAKNTTTKNNEALYASSQYRNGIHTFNIGGRYEKASFSFNDPSSNAQQNDALYSYELGYSSLINNEQSIFTHYGHGFQFPDIDRFFKTDFSVSPYVTSFNGLIAPMQTDTYTLGYTYIDHSTKLKTSVYYVNLKNEIYYYENYPNTVYANTNIDKSHKCGFDFNYIRSLAETFTISTGYNYVKAIIDDEKIDGKDFSGKELPGVSNHSVQATLTYLPNSNTSLSLGEIYRSQAYAQLDFGNDFKQKQDAYYSTNLTFNYTKENYEFFVKMNNLFDRTNGVWIRDDQIYPADFKRSVTAGLKFIF